MNLILKQLLKYLISLKDSYTKYKYPDQKKSANFILQFPGDNPSLKEFGTKNTSMNWRQELKHRE